MPQTIPALVINLDRARSRWDHMLSVAKELGLEFERMPATDAHDPRFLAGLPERPLDHFGRPLSYGDVACLYSHRQTWRMMVERDIPFLAVFEDDIYASRDLPAFLSDTSWIPDDADLVRLNFYARLHTLSRRSWKAPAGRAIRRLERLALNSDGYLLTRKGARRLLADRGDIMGMVDELLFSDTPERAVVYQVLPSLCIQSDSRSEGGSSLLTSQIVSGRREMGSYGRRDLERDPGPGSTARRVVSPLSLLATKVVTKARISGRSFMRLVGNLFHPTEFRTFVGYR